MHLYETLFILHPDVAEAQVQDVLNRTKNLIEGMDGTVETMETWGMRDLAYSIRKQKRGTYVIAVYRARSEVVTELERTMKLGDDFLRFVSVRLPKGYSPASKARLSSGSETERAESAPEQVS